MRIKSKTTKKQRTLQLYAGRTGRALEEAKTTKVFVCCSGGRSLALAKRFGAFLVAVIPDLENQVFVSTHAR